MKHISTLKETLLTNGKLVHKETTFEQNVVTINFKTANEPTKVVEKENTTVVEDKTVKTENATPKKQEIKELPKTGDISTFAPLFGMFGLISSIGLMFKKREN